MTETSEFSFVKDFLSPIYLFLVHFFTAFMIFFVKIFKIICNVIKTILKCIIKPKTIKIYIQNFRIKIFAEQKSIQTLIRFFKEYVRKYIIYIIASVIFMIIVASLTSAIAFVVGPLINKVFVEKSATLLYASCLLLIGLYLAKTICAYLQEVCLKTMVAKIMSDLRLKLFNKVIRMPMKNKDKVPSGSVVTIFFTDILMISGSAQELFVTAIRDFLTVVFLAFVVIYNDWMLAIVAICAYPFVFVPLAKSSKSAKVKYTMGQDCVQDLSAKISDVENGIKTIKSYNTENIEARNVKRLLLQFTRIMIDYSKKLALASPAMELACGLSMVFIIFVGGKRIIAGTSDIGSFFSFLTALIMVHRPARSLAGIKIKTNMTCGALERVFSFEDSLVVEDLDNGLKPNMLNPTIKFENVNFNYSDRDEEGEIKILQNINMEIKPNSRVALVGMSGSGKSTLASLLFRLYERDSGVISINDIDIKDIAISHLRKNIAYVGQDNFLFDDTVRNNILYGASSMQTEEDLYKAVSVAQVNFLQDTDNGINENVGYNGSRFSMGQKQRIAIARAIIKDAPIVIFDEATSALDATTETAIRDAIFENMKNKTTIIIAHRLSTIVNCDAIYVMEGGRIVEFGKHKELLLKNGLYKHLWDNFSNGFQEQKNNDNAGK